MIINNSTLTKKAFNLKNVQYLYNNYIYDGIVMLIMVKNYYFKME